MNSAVLPSVFKAMKKIIAFLLLGVATGKVNGQFNLQLLGHLPFPGTTCAGVWHHVDSAGNEYALVGAGNGLAIADVTDPANPTLLLTVPAANSLWREIKTFGDYAYATTEGGGGVTIVNLAYLPDSVQHKVYTGDGPIAGQLGSAHTCQVDDEGYLFVFGSDIGNGGAIICDLNPDPWNPVFTGQYDLEYIHDGYILNDTLWAGEIYAGQFSVIDVSDRSNPVLLATQQTPGQFCHNTWLSDDHATLFTTDEVKNAPLAAYDVRDITNIQLIGTYLTDSMPSEEVHNVRVIDDFLVNPSYGSQLTIVDAARPGNLIEIANYKTGNQLCWDATPYLPSGHIVATDEFDGLYVFAPYYVRACYLEGNVTDSVTGQPVGGTTVSILGAGKTTASGFSGDYKTGTPSPGTFDVAFSKGGYITKTISGVALNTGVLTTLDVELVPFFAAGQVVETGTGNPIPNAHVLIEDAGGSSFTLSTDATGNFSLSGVTSGATVFTAGKWGFHTRCLTQTLPAAAPLVINLDPGYYDDYTFDFGWTVTSTCTVGDWERAVPVGTGAAIWFNPNEDVQNDCSNQCYVTANIGGNPVMGDVDDGYTQLSSPLMDLSTYNDPYINYARWFVDIGVNVANNDTLFIRMDNGGPAVDIEQVFNGMTPTSQWVTQSLRIADFITPGPGMTVTVFTEDKPGTASTLECGFDKFFISEGPVGTGDVLNQERAGQVLLYPNPVTEEAVLYSPLFAENEIRLDLADATGRTLEQRKFSMQADGIIRMPVSHLAPGVYIVLLQAGDKLLSKKLIRK